MICFPPPLNFCVPVSYGPPLAQVSEDDSEVAAIFAEED